MRAGGLHGRTSISGGVLGHLGMMEEFYDTYPMACPESRKMFFMQKRKPEEGKRTAST